MLTRHQLAAHHYQLELEPVRNRNTRAARLAPYKAGWDLVAGARGYNEDMLLSKQIANLAVELCEEARFTPLRTIIPQVADDQLFWTVVVEMVEIVLHRHDFVIVERHRVKGESPNQTETT